MSLTDFYSQNSGLRQRGLPLVLAMIAGSIVSFNMPSDPARPDDQPLRSAFLQAGTAYRERHKMDATAREENVRGRPNRKKSSPHFC